jgi:hypothetical protein
MTSIRVWTDEVILTIRDMAEVQGMTGTAIGNHFGVTRNCIIGLCNRRGIQLPGRACNPKSPKRPRTFTPKVLKPRVQIIEPAPPPANPVTFGELRFFRETMSNQCRNFLHGHSGDKGLVCATTTDPGESYCRLCRGPLYVKPTARKGPGFRFKSFQRSSLRAA